MSVGACMNRSRELLLALRLPERFLLALQELLSFPFRVRPCRQITHKPREPGWVIARHSRDGDFHRELMTVRVIARRFHATIDERSLAGGQVARETPAVLFAELTWNQQLRQLPTERLFPSISERALGRGVELRDRVPGDPSR